ncbi:MAG: hypothetical protein QXI09_01280 [Candidatus Aenigmatarchaeota archaeon]
MGEDSESSYSLKIKEKIREILEEYREIKYEPEKPSIDSIYDYDEIERWGLGI